MSRSVAQASLSFRIFFFNFFFSELGTEPRALCFLGKRSTTELNPQPLASVFECWHSSCLLSNASLWNSIAFTFAYSASLLGPPCWSVPRIHRASSRSYWIIGIIALRRIYFFNKSVTWNLYLSPVSIKKKKKTTNNHYGAGTAEITGEQNWNNRKKERKKKRKATLDKIHI